MISVIIPSYKPGKYIEECLKSLSLQDLPAEKFEIIIVLNGCNAPWRTQIQTLIDEYLSHHNVHLIQTDVPGVSNARNIGIDKAKGLYISFIDDDDYISASYLKELLNTAASDTVSLSNAMAFIDETGDFLTKYPQSLNFKANNPKQPLSVFHALKYFNGPCMKLIPREVMGGCRFDTKLANGEDSVYMFQISKNIKHVIFTPDNAIYYRRYRKQSATTSKKTTSYWIRNSFKCASSYTRFYLSDPRRYNFFLYCRYMLACAKTACIEIFNNMKHMGDSK